MEPAALRGMRRVREGDENAALVTVSINPKRLLRSRTRFLYITIPSVTSPVVESRLMLLILEWTQRFFSSLVFDTVATPLYQLGAKLGIWMCWRRSPRR
jgi:hypothetical protein